MPEKHINRKRKRDNSEDEWSHLTKGAGEKIDATDAMDITDRSITFKNEFGVPITNFELYEEEKEKVQDQVGNTAQYIKFANESIREKKNKMDKIQELQKKFQDDIDALQGNVKAKEDLDKIRYQDIKACDIEQALTYMQKERNALKKKMDHHAQQVSRSQLDLLEKDKEIANIKAELEVLKQNAPIEEKKPEIPEDPIEDLKNKLNKIGDDKEKEEILKNLKSLVNKLNSDEVNGDSLRSNYIK